MHECVYANTINNTITYVRFMILVHRIKDLLTNQDIILCKRQSSGNQANKCLSRVAQTFFM